jgi:hypothetical protein
MKPNFKTIKLETVAFQTDCEDIVDMKKCVGGNFEIFFLKKSASVQDIDSVGDSINASLLSFQDDPKVKIKICNKDRPNVVGKLW